jgi:hypothetical protein
MMMTTTMRMPKNKSFRPPIISWLVVLWKMSDQWHFGGNLSSLLTTSSPQTAASASVEDVTALHGRYASFAYRVGLKADVHWVPLSTALVFVHRALLRWHSFHFPRQHQGQGSSRQGPFNLPPVHDLVPACLFLAIKTEEQPRSLKSILQASMAVRFSSPHSSNDGKEKGDSGDGKEKKNDGKETRDDRREEEEKEEREEEKAWMAMDVDPEWRQRVLRLERTLLVLLCFDLQINNAAPQRTLRAFFKQHISSITDHNAEEEGGRRSKSSRATPRSKKSSHPLALWEQWRALAWELGWLAAHASLLCLQYAGPDIAHGILQCTRPGDMDGVDLPNVDPEASTAINDELGRLANRLPVK